jgi:hypothetical protein
METFTEQKLCRVCGGELAVMLDLGDQYLPRWCKDGALDKPHAPLRLARCSSCGLLQLADTVHPDLLYREFWYRSGMNQTMRDALKDITIDAFAYHAAGGWLDIGANDGTLLSLLPRSFKRFACEPALNFAPELAKIADAVLPDYFKAGIATGIQVITSIACFYDVADPNAFVKAIAETLAQDGIWINQLNDSPAMLRQNAFDSICHEHLFYYDVPSLERIYAKHGLEIIDVTTNDVNGGSIRVIAGFKGRHLVHYRGTHHQPSEDDVRAFARRTERWRGHVREILRTLPRPIWGYGASTKGSTLLQYLGANHSFEGIADRNPLKYGTEQPGLWIHVRSEAEMRADSPGTLFVLPWAFRKEFIEREEGLRRNGTVMFFPLPHPELVL